MADGEFAAMVSTQSKLWKSIPRVPLMSRLDEKTKKRIVRSDWLSVEGAPEPLPDTMPTLPSKLPEGFSKGDLWFDTLLRSDQRPHNTISREDIALSLCVCLHASDTFI
jgi:hypothetical protein